MEDKFAIQLFEGKKVRVVWDEEQEKYFFSVVDIIQVLTDSVNPADYIKKMKSRDKELAEGWGQIVTPLAYRTAGGKQKAKKDELPFDDENK
jgi:hypothetical protein